MRYYEYSPNQLERKANEALAQYDKKRLEQANSIDVYDVIEKLLDVPYDWKYITPDQSILGATAFNAGYMWVWPESVYYDGLLPYRIPVEKGTIIIDSTLTESDNRGRENFTVMHEVFHQLLHKKCFRSEPADYVHGTTSKALTSHGHKKLVTALDIIEYQANFSAACFLMPREGTINAFHKMFDKTAYGKWKTIYLDSVIAKMAEEFNVSETAMKYRLEYLKKLQKRGVSGCYEPVDI